MAGFLSTLKSMVGLAGHKQSGAKGLIGRRIGARFDAAVTNIDNRRHWAAADTLSANASITPEVRRILRARARYEAGNNSYASGIIETLANYVVGTGPRLQMLTGNKDANRFIEREFREWCKAVYWAESLQLTRSERAVSGESFILQSTNEQLETPVKLYPHVIEADQVATPNLNVLTDPNSVDGIERDSSGHPTAYHLLKFHPGDNSIGQSMDYDRIPAKQMIHHFRRKRPGQSRGIPEITPALPLFAQLRRYTLAVLAAAETAADFAAVIQSGQSPDSDGIAEAFETVELERRMATVLPAGYQIGQIKAEQPTTTFGEFQNRILNEIARSVVMPFNIAAGNSSSYNYSSGRLDFQAFYRFIVVDRASIENRISDRLFKSWFDEAVLIDGYLPQSARMRNADRSHRWFWDGFEHVDPVKEAVAQQTRLQSNTTTLADECARDGEDWEEVLEQRSKERKRMIELGLPVDQAVTINPQDLNDEQVPQQQAA